MIGTQNQTVVTHWKDRALAAEAKVEQLQEERENADEVRVLVTALRDTYADLLQMVPGLTKPYVEKILDGYKGLEDHTAVDPGDLYTILRCFYAAGRDGILWSQAEQHCAERLNRVLCAVGWEFRPEQLDGPEGGA
jgi:hypothetical protein